MSVYFIVLQMYNSSKLQKQLGWLKSGYHSSGTKSGHCRDFFINSILHLKQLIEAFCPSPPKKNLPNHQSLRIPGMSKRITPKILLMRIGNLKPNKNPILGSGPLGSQRKCHPSNSGAAGGCAAVVGSRGSRSTKRIEELLWSDAWMARLKGGSGSINSHWPIGFPMVGIDSSTL